MANGEWLTQLMAGLGGAFTGATQARERMSIEEERKRREDEARTAREQERQRRELAAGLFRGQPTMAQLGEYLGQGGDVTTASLAARLGQPPEAKPTYEERPEDGGIAIYRGGEFASWKRQPNRPRPTTPGPSRTQQGAGLVMLRRFLDDPSLATNAAEKARREALVRTLRTQYEGISDAELGMMLSGGMRSIPRPPMDSEDEWD